MNILRFLIVSLVASFLALGVRAQQLEQTDSLPADRTVRLLTIGNSFSQDGVEQYLWELADEVGIRMIIGNAYRGGQSLASHWREVTEDNHVIEYRKVVDGVRTNKPGKVLADIIPDEPWDYITFQQVSQESGMVGTIEPYLTDLIRYVQTQQTNPDAVYGYHQTWAYAHDSTHGGFANYDNRQDVMYDSICSTVQQVMAQHPDLQFVVPSGTAIQNARTTYLGDNMNRDGYHLDLKMGRYTAACVWLEAITGISPVGLSFRPEGLDSLTARTCQVAAHAAVLHPYVCTVLDYEGLPAVNEEVPSGLVKLNFGAGATSDSTWNDITPDIRTQTSIVDSKLRPTGILVTITGEFGGANRNGAAYTTTRMLMPADVSQSGLWGYATGRFGNQAPRPSASIRLSHLNAKLTYDFNIFSSREGSHESRQSCFVVQGDGIHACSIESANNASKVAVIKGVRPTPDGQITLTVLPGSCNNHPNHFYYLNAITIKTHK